MDALGNYFVAYQLCGHGGTEIKKTSRKILHESDFLGFLDDCYKITRSPAFGGLGATQRRAVSQKWLMFC